MRPLAIPNGKTKTLLAIIAYLALALYTIVGKPNSGAVASAIDTKVVVLETELKNVRADIERNRNETQQYRTENREEHGTINGKLDRLISRNPTTERNPN